MHQERLRILLVDDEDSFRLPLKQYLESHYPFRVEDVSNAAQAWQRVLTAEKPYDVALVDDLLAPEPGTPPQPIGIELLGQILRHSPETAGLVFTGWGMERAVQALQAGAYRYLAKPPNLQELGVTIQMAAQQAELRRERDLLAATLMISNTMIGGLELGRTLQVIGEAVPRLTGAEACAVSRLGPKTGHLRHELLVPLGDASVRWSRHLKGIDLTRRILESGEVFVMPDVAAQAEGVDEELQRAGVRSFVGVPIPGDPVNWGVLYAYSTRPEAFGTHEQQVLQLLAGQAALALKNACLFDEVQRRARDLETLQKLALILNSSLDLDHTLRSVCQAAVEFFEADHSGLVLFEPDYSQGRVEAEYPDLGARGTVIPVRGIPEEERLVRGKEPIVIDRVSERKTLGPVRDILLGFDIRSILIAPVLDSRHQLLGSFSLDAIGRLRPFTEEEVSLCQVFAAHVAVAIQNARLFSELNEATEWRKALIENAFDAVIAIDQKRRITVFNQQAEEMLGWKTEEMIGQKVTCLHMDLEKAREIYDLVNRDGSVSEWSIDLKHRNGSCIPALLSATLLRDNQGRPWGQAGYLRDLRRIRLLEGRMRALMEVIQAVTGTLALNEVLERIVQSALAAFPAAQSGVIHLHDPESGTLRPQACSYPLGPEAKEAWVFCYGEGIVGWVFQHGQSLALDDAQVDVRYKQIVHPEVPPLRAVICAPLKSRGRVIGTLLLANHSSPGVFQGEDRALLRSFADQAAIAITNAQLFQEQALLLHQLTRVRDEAKTIAQVTALGDPMTTLHSVVKAAQQVLRCDIATLYTYDEEKRCFDQAVGIGYKRPDHMRLPDQITEGSVLWRILELGEPYYHYAECAPDDRLLSGDFVHKEGVQSALGILIRFEGQRVGVAFFNYRGPHRFSSHELAAAQLFADQAAVAIRNARLYEDLKQTRELVEARTFLACTGMIHNTWRHVIEKHALTIREEAEHLRQDWKEASVQASRAEKRLTKIQRLATEILEKPVTPPLSSEQGVEKVSLNLLIRERARQLWENERYQIAEFALDLQLPDNVTVRASPQWLRRAVDMLVDNAVKAVADCPVRRITFGTRLKNGRAEVLISDTGPGIPEEIREQIGLKWIEKPEKGQGMGMGLLMSRFIAQTYGGGIRVESTGPTGTTMALWLPVKE